MTSIHRTSFAFAFGLLTATLACGGQSTPSTADDGSNGSPITASGAGQACDAQPAPTARCGAACPYGYKGELGTYSCECCAAPAGSDAGSSDASATSDAASDADAGEICGGPPPNARCMACPLGSKGYKQIDGQPTCECCSP